MTTPSSTSGDCRMGVGSWIATDGSVKCSRSSFQEKPSRDEARSDLANCGVYVIQPELLDRVPPNTFYDFGNDVWLNRVLRRLSEVATSEAAR